MENAKDYRIVFITTNSYDNAVQITKILLSEKLAACCSIIQNVTSVFGWKDAIQERNEFIMMIKTSENALEKLEARALELHNDEVPEVISISMDKALPAYLDWMKEALSE